MYAPQKHVLTFFAVTLLVFSVGHTAVAEVIDPTNCTITAVNEWGSREAAHALDGSGLNPVEGDTGAVHTGLANPNYIAWHSLILGTTAEPAIEHSWLIVGLGGSCNTDSINLWNYNHEGGYESETPTGELARGVKDFNLWIRNDGTAGNNTHGSGAVFDSTGWTQVSSNNTLQPGTGLDGYLGESFSLTGNATHVAIEILSNHEGTVTANGTLSDGYGLGTIVGLSEVRVFSAVPEPSTLVLLMLAGCMVFLKRAR